MSKYQVIPLESVKRLESPYLNFGRKMETWVIDSIEVDGNLMRAKVRFEEYFLSPTDNGFHLSNLSGLEIVAQLRIIHIHLCLGLQEKSKELWFLKGEERCLSPIRDYQNIFVEMELKFYCSEGKNLVKMIASLTDPLGGLFEYNASVLM